MMANLGNNVKTAFLKGLEALGKTASSLTGAAQQKLSEMNLETRRRELLAEIPKCVMQLWKDGAEMPEPLAELLNELTVLDEKLAAMRPQPEPPKEAAAESEEASQECPCDEACGNTAEEPAAEEASEEDTPEEEPSCCRTEETPSNEADSEEENEDEN